MKSNIKHLFFYVGKVFSYLYSNRLISIYRGIKTRIYSGWVSSQFKQFSNDSIIKAPLFLHGAKYISIGKNSAINKNGVLTAWDQYRKYRFQPQITIGNNVNIGEYCHITSINKIVIGNGVLTGRWVTITDNSHGISDKTSLTLSPAERELYSSGIVIIEDNVWIGDKVTILPNVHIGKNSIIGANSIVTKDIPENSVAIGNPAKIIKTII